MKSERGVREREIGEGRERERERSHIFLALTICFHGEAHLSLKSLIAHVEVC